LSEGLKLQLHARSILLPHPSAGMLHIEAPLSPEMKEGFRKFGFSEDEADAEPFARRQTKRR
ncbi:MAG TPA: RluA family pseudouridine synthase, partial [Caulobacter sp.]|nr:RluA family pseudouridine synthase [Caulobacter sp.]